MNDELKHIENQRKRICSKCSCDVDFSNPNSKCPNGLWSSITFGPENKIGTYSYKQPHTVSFEGIFEKSKEKYPSVFKMARSFAGAAAEEIKAIASGVDSISKEEKQKRLDICSSCDFFEKKHGRCKKCGCILLLKASWRSQECPIGKW